MNEVAQECKNILKNGGIDISSEIDFDVNGTIHTLSFEYIIDTFMQASDDSQDVFLIALKKSLDADESGVSQFFEGMGQLLLMTHLSQKM